MPFRYNLQKILNFRITKRDEQIEVVKKAQMEVDRIQQEIDLKHKEIQGIRSDMRQCQPIMLEAYDRYLKHLYQQLEKLEIDKQEAEKKLKIEEEKLSECEKNVKVLEKHKEKKKEEYLAEEKAAELKQMNETASIKHFRKTREAQEEQEYEEYLQGLQNDEY